MATHNHNRSQAVHIKCSAKGSVKEEGDKKLAKLSFQGYSGDSVDLADYGFDAPVVYRISGIRNKQKIPIMYNHRTAIGHTTSVHKSSGDTLLTGRGVASLPGDDTKRVVEGIQNGFPFEASMGLNINNWSKDISFHAKESVVINGRTFQAPVYVVERSSLVEMTVTEFGRDSNTTFEVLNEERRMTIKNAAGSPTDEKVKDTPPVDNQEGGEEKDSKDVKNTKPDTKETKEEDKPPVKIDNSNQPWKTAIRVQKLLNKHAEHAEIIENGIDQGWDDERIESQIELTILRNSRKGPPTGDAKTTKDSFKMELSARAAKSAGVSMERIAKVYGNVVADKVDNMGLMGPLEMATLIANQHGASFTGFEHPDTIARYITNSVGQFNAFSMPNALESAGSLMLEERWALNPPWATQNLPEGSMQNFMPSKSVRITAGEKWESVDANGKLKMTSFGTEKTYTRSLDTVGQMLVIDRETFVNDDRGALNQVMEAMVESAMIVPEEKLCKLMLGQADGTFWVGSGTTRNSYASTALTAANFETVYNAARTYDEKRGNATLQQIAAGRWKLLHGVDLERTVFELFGQQYIVGDTTVNTKTGQSNYWYRKVDSQLFPQMGNYALAGTTLAAPVFATALSWVLWPVEKRYAPYELTYLRGQKKPIIESVPLPGDYLGFGTRGYWDVEVNARENLLVARAKSAA